MADILAKQKALENILATDKAFLTPAEIAPILGVNPHSIRIAARQHPDSLKFDFIVSGNRTKIPRLPFLRYIGINIDNSPVQGSAAPVSEPLAGESMTGIDPLLIITQTIPSVAIAPLLVLWFGYEMMPKIILVVLSTFFPIAVGLLEGFRSADKDAIDLLRSMGANPVQIFCYIKLIFNI